MIVSFPIGTLLNYIYSISSDLRFNIFAQRGSYPCILYRLVLSVLMSVIFAHIYTSHHIPYHHIYPFEYLLINIFHLPQPGYLPSSIHPFSAYLHRQLFLPSQ